MGVWLEPAGLEFDSTVVLTITFPDTASGGIGGDLRGIFIDPDRTFYTIMPTDIDTVASVLACTLSHFSIYGTDDVTYEYLKTLIEETTEYGLEFHHCYVGGLPLQVFWGSVHPLDLSRVTGIAGYVRKHGSGREIPRYIIQTGLGEVDYGISSEIFDSGEDKQVMVKLLPYGLDYFKHLDRTFSLPSGAVLDEDETIVVPVTGLKLSMVERPIQ